MQNHYDTAQMIPSLNSGRNRQAKALHRGFFAPYSEFKFRDVKDGLSNTIAMGEIGSYDGDNRITTSISWDPGGGNHDVANDPLHCVNSNEIDPERPRFWCDTQSTNCTPPVRLTAGDTNGRGMSWASAFRLCIQTVFTVRPPNSELCIGRWADNIGNFSPSSFHQGGAHVLMGDGAVIFMTDSIEAGNQSSPTPADPALYPNNRAGAASPYGLWGALGTKAASEPVEEQLNQ
jgi:prepilin-type processing-associated H-X9-DG protein